MATFTDYSNKTIDGQMCIWLQSYGFAPAKKASEFKVGEKTLWNWGISEEIVAIEEVSAKFLSITIKGKDGKTYPGRYKKDRLIAIGK